MSKVKLTREQAEELEIQKRELKSKDIVQRRILTTYPNSVFTSIELDTLIKALYIGYEIKEKFKVGDWVILSIGSKEIVREYHSTSHMEGHYFYKNLNDSPRPFSENNFIRHATPEEITEEKERRWWAKHGRSVWELKEGDCLIRRHNPHTCNVKFVEAADEDLILLVDGIRDESYETKNDLEVMMKKYEVFCFVEDRKDGRVNE